MKQHRPGDWVTSGSLRTRSLDLAAQVGAASRREMTTPSAQEAHTVFPAS